MKKLMVICATIAMAAAAHAAAIDWSVANNSWTLKNGSKAASGTTVYLIDATASSTLFASVGKDGSFNAAQAGVFGSAATVNGKGSVTTVTAKSDALVAGKSYDFAILVIDTASDAKQAYALISGASTQTAYDPNATPPAPTSVGFGATQFSSPTTSWTQAGGSSPEPTPEPTSGLLLLLGMAGLALKRKIA